MQEKTPAVVPESDSESDTPANLMRPPALSKSSPLEVKDTRDTSEDDRPCNNGRTYDPKAADDRTKRKVAVVRPEVRTDPWKESDERVRAKQLSSDDDMRRKNRSPLKMKPSIPHVQSRFKRSGSCSDSASEVELPERGSRGRRSAIGTSDSDRSRILSPKKWSHSLKPMMSAVSASDSEEEVKPGTKAKVVRRRKSNSKRTTVPSDSEEEARSQVKRHTPKPKLRASPIRSASEEEPRKVRPTYL